MSQRWSWPSIMMSSPSLTIVSARVVGASASDMPMSSVTCAANLMQPLLASSRLSHQAARSRSDNLQALILAPELAPNSTGRCENARLTRSVGGNAIPESRALRDVKQLSPFVRDNRALWPAIMRTALTGRTHGCTDQCCGVRF